ncbi:helix-turn-helix domain-containing protein [Desulfovibrio litoralis]|uniref:Helix-turn-helix n=1 Tax=Desulfovibrio litoralis DSM 11393 TaxID=1121455 RepID=A0A1M7T7L8_9BACT|nr:helix-turn-helix transcriptional regulator [Desulfovibrio litoralis]SHN66719.1 Helix-turn-helix [Desulfovibrio litoralis DSM 11393]
MKTHNNTKTQQDIATKCNISQPHFSNIVNKRRVPAPIVAKKLEEVTGISRLYWLYPDEFDQAGNRVFQTT